MQSRLDREPATAEREPGVVVERGGRLAGPVLLVVPVATPEEAPAPCEVRDRAPGHRGIARIARPREGERGLAGVVRTLDVERDTARTIVLVLHLAIGARLRPQEGGERRCLVRASRRPGTRGGRARLRRDRRCAIPRRCSARPRTGRARSADNPRRVARPRARPHRRGGRRARRAPRSSRRGVASCGPVSPGPSAHRRGSETCPRVRDSERDSHSLHGEPGRRSRR